MRGERKGKESLNSYKIKKDGKIKFSDGILLSNLSLCQILSYPTNKQNNNNKKRCGKTYCPYYGYFSFALVNF